MSEKSPSNPFDKYMLAGGMEAAAQSGVARARADLQAHGITPHDETNMPSLEAGQKPTTKVLNMPFPMGNAKSNAGELPE